MSMENGLTFNDLPQVVAELRDEVIGMRQMLTCLQEENGQRKDNTHRERGVAAHWKYKQETISQNEDELDKWLECNRKNPVPLTVEEENAAVLASNRRKPSNRNW